MSKKIAILDYEMGNLFSVKNAFLSLGIETEITSDKKTIEKADAVILPGVGAFGQAMENFKRLDLVDTFRDVCHSGRPVLGICLGLQILFEESEEFGINRGLEIIKGTVKKFQAGQNTSQKIPHIGWNKVEQAKQWVNSPLSALTNGEFLYFVHSYYVEPSDKDVAACITDYEGFSFCSGIRYGNIFASQFHPEKSGKTGLSIFKSWHDNYVIS